MHRLRQLLGLAVLLPCFATPLRAAETGDDGAIDFITQVQPILAEHCTHCHGVDQESRQGGLRLDLQSDAFTGGDSGEPAIVPGNVELGELLRRVTSDDADEVMPPPSENKPLHRDQIQVLQHWIAAGAEYEKHWAFVPPQKVELDRSNGQHPIDAIVDRKLAEVGIPTSSPADSETLARRIYLDAIGLPPSIEQVEAFKSDGVAATVQQLLASERFGEKWARHWLDVARYSDTNGYEKDLRREQWIWRDWVIDAINRDLPYDQFIRQQIAGDLIPGASQDQIIATGFLRNSMLNEEGAIVPEQFRIAEIIDRIDCIGKAVLGVTVQCAQCHTHKFDPISHDEYFGMFAYLNNAHEAQSWVYDDAGLKKKAEVETAMQQIDDQVRRETDNWEASVEDFASSIRDQQPTWQPITFHQLETISGLNHPVQLDDQSILMLGHASADVFFVGKHNLAGATGIRLEALPHDDLPFGGPGRSSVGGWNVLEIEVLIKRPGSDAWEKQQLIDATADFSSPDVKTDEGKNSVGQVAYLIDGNDAHSWRSDRGSGRRNQASVAVVRFETPLDCLPETEIKFVMRTGEMLGSCRVSTTTEEAPSAPSVDFAAVLAAIKPTDQRSPDEVASLFSAWRQSMPRWQTESDRIESLWADYPQPLTSVLHLEQPAGDRSRTTHLLDRGEWDHPKHEVQPHVPAAFHPLEKPPTNDRLAFADWLIDERSPLAARVAVNRAWQTIFGAGLVETADDFGTRAPVPEHRELLDWLAVDLMEHGWSQKRLIQQILESKTYQRSSIATLRQLEVDPNNRWLARGPRFRADAEVVRDIALSVSGLIKHELGGPPVIPPVPQNVLDYNYVYPAYWTAATGPQRYRRAIYGFRKRSMPDPVMSSLDAPNGDSACAQRARSNTPLAALTGLNETVFVEAAQALGLRVLREGGADDKARAAFAFRLCTARGPNENEAVELQRLIDQQRQRLADGWLNPREIITGDPDKLPELPPTTTPQDAAVWTLVGRVLLNLDETICKN